MKRIISIALIFALVIALCSCGGKPERMSDTMYQIGLNALTTTDEYISGKITGEEASERIYEFKEQSDAEYEKVKGGQNGSTSVADTAYVKDFIVSSDLFFLYFAVRDASMGKGAMSDVKERRDDLAETLGKKSSNKEENQTEDTTISDSYSYEQEMEIKNFIKEKISAYNLDTFVRESEGGIEMDFNLKRVEKGSEAMFADVLELIKTSVKEAKTTYNFDLSNLRLTFLIYKNEFTEDTSKMITFETNDLQTGTLLNSIGGSFKDNITVDEAIEELRN